MPGMVGGGCFLFTKNTTKAFLWNSKEIILPMRMALYSIPVRAVYSLRDFLFFELYIEKNF